MAGEMEGLPAVVRTEFDGSGRHGGSGLAHLLVTQDTDGSPRPCLLGPGEILAVDDATVRLAVWPDSSTAANLRAGSPVLLCFVAADTVVHVRGRPMRSWRGDWLGVEVHVTGVRADEHAGYAILDGIRFAYQGPDQERRLAWASQLAFLRGGPDGSG